MINIEMFDVQIFEINNMKMLQFYMEQKYNVEIKALPDDGYSAEISEIPGLCAYGTTEIEFLIELDNVKRTAFELMLEQNKQIPLPIRKFAIPVEELKSMPCREELEKYALA
jgi:predicted RNase H-like HicB family nuclease